MNKDKIIASFDKRLESLAKDLDVLKLNPNYRHLGIATQSYIQEQLVLEKTMDTLHTYKLVFENEASEEFYRGENVMEVKAGEALSRFIHKWYDLASHVDKDAGRVFASVVEYKVAKKVLRFMYQYLNTEQKAALQVLKIRIFN